MLTLSTASCTTQFSWLYFQSIRGFFGFEASFQNCFWNVLAPLVRLKSVKYEMSGSFKVRSQ
jgi:hypothetical protein